MFIWIGNSESRTFTAGHYHLWIQHFLCNHQAAVGLTQCATCAVATFPCMFASQSVDCGIYACDSWEQTVYTILIVPDVISYKRFWNIRSKNVFPIQVPNCIHHFEESIWEQTHQPLLFFWLFCFYKCERVDPSCQKRILQSLVPLSDLTS